MMEFAKRLPSTQACARWRRKWSRWMPFPSISSMLRVRGFNFDEIEFRSWDNMRWEKFQGLQEQLKEPAHQESALSITVMSLPYTAKPASYQPSSASQWRNRRERSY